MRLAVIVALAAVTIASKVNAAPTENGMPTDQDTKTQEPRVSFLHIKSEIKSRYATTLVTSKIANPASKAQEVVYQITIPESAFISNFTMLVGNDLMEGQVQERVKAKQEYHAAQQAGQSAGHVATATVRDSNKVRISVNVAAQAKVTFNLTYEELLVRRKGRYELAINVNPGQKVADLAIDVYIEENRNITLLQVPEFRSTNEIDFEERDEISNLTEIKRLSKEKLHLHFAPDEATQVLLSGAKGLGGRFLVRYDVDRKNQPLSEVLTNDGYFVHFFSPPELQPLPKHVVFVLDVSGSMYGKKMSQLKEAMTAILDELRPSDYFNLVEFSHPVTIFDMDTPSNSIVIQPNEARPWYEPQATISPENVHSSVPDKVKAFPATADYIKKAKESVEKMTANGGTNIHDAIRAAIQVTERAVPLAGFGAELPSPIIIFLTDGEATVGETRVEKILQLINKEQIAPIFSLAFGNDADFPFVKRISDRAHAFARKIYDDSDAALQLRDFFRHISSPVLQNVTFNYTDSKVESEVLTKNQFDLMFSGSEIVVAGKLREDNVGLEGSVLSSRDTYPFLPLPGVIPEARNRTNDGNNFLERLWAFLTIKQKLKEFDALEAPEAQDGNETPEAKKAKEEALRLSLKFSFVTPLTSLVVVKKEKSESSNSNSSEANNVLSIGNADVNPATYSQHGGYSFSNSVALSSRLPAQPQHMVLSSAAMRPSAPGLAGASSGGFGGAAMARPQPIAAQVEEEADRLVISEPERVIVPHVAEDKGFEEQIDTSTDETVTTQEGPSSPSPQLSTESPVPVADIKSTKISDISWLVPTESQSTNSSDWQSFKLGSNSEVYKILSFAKSQNVTGAKCEKLSTPSTCKPFAACVPKSFHTMSTPDQFIQNFKCDVTIDGESYLGVCCPDDNQDVTTTRLESEAI